jgi:hypothetical protein
VRWLTSIIALYAATTCLINNFGFGYLLAASAFGFATFPVVPVSLELMTRKFSNIPYYTTNSLMGVCSQLFSVLMQSILGMVMVWCPDNGGLVVVVVILYLLMASYWFVKGIDNDVF